jgi:hypothetical protein
VRIVSAKTDIGGAISEISMRAPDSFRASDDAVRYSKAWSVSPILKSSLPSSISDASSPLALSASAVAEMVR